jgi:hypothetical protein
MDGEGQIPHQVSLPRRGNREIADLLRKDGAGRPGDRKGISVLPFVFASRTHRELFEASPPPLLPPRSLPTQIPAIVHTSASSPDGLSSFLPTSSISRRPTHFLRSDLLSIETH